MVSGVCPLPYDLLPASGDQTTCGAISMVARASTVQGIEKPDFGQLGLNVESALSVTSRNCESGLTTH
jgi:hypothetical protein